MDERLEEARQTLESHDKVDHTWTDDELDDVLFVCLDWVTESHMENGTRIIESKEYDGHIREVSQAIEDLDGVHRSRTLDGRMHGKTFVVEPGAGRRGF